MAVLHSKLLTLSDALRWCAASAFVALLRARDNGETRGVTGAAPRLPAPRHAQAKQDWPCQHPQAVPCSYRTKLAY